MQLWNQSAQLAKLKQFVFNCCLCISAIYRVSRIISNHTVAVCLFRIPRNVWLYMNHCFIHGLYKYQISYRAAKRRFKKKCSKLVIRVLNIFPGNYIDYIPQIIMSKLRNLLHASEKSASSLHALYALLELLAFNNNVQGGPYVSERFCEAV